MLFPQLFREKFPLGWMIKIDWSFRVKKALRPFDEVESRGEWRMPVENRGQVMRVTECWREGGRKGGLVNQTSPLRVLIKMLWINVQAELELWALRINSVSRRLLYRKWEEKSRGPCKWAESNLQNFFIAEILKPTSQKG